MNEDLSGFAARLANSAGDVETVLGRLINAAGREGAFEPPQRLTAAMRYAVLNGGKRLRPFFLLESARLFKPAHQDRQPDDPALRVAAALECVHCYSLVHDDLPAMDDDDLRRGLPTVHVAFDEATAILAGDALLTLAFDILSSPATALPDDRKVALVALLAQAAGAGGMVGGQMRDLDAEKDVPDEDGIVALQAMKTGALIRYACAAGATIAGAAASDRAAMTRFGEKVGLAFQLADDLLDLTSDAASLGKATGKDAVRGKATLVSLHGAQWARDRLDALVREAEDLLRPYGPAAAVLLVAARFAADRRN